jgi:IclR family pca regulon transcriptional regulator
VRAATQSNRQKSAPSVPTLREQRYSQSLERGLAILVCFTPKRPVLGIADIAESLGMVRSTTHRYVTTLVALGYLEQDPSSKYRLGTRVADLGMSAFKSMGLREHAHPYLEELRRQTSCTTNLGVIHGTDVLYVDRLRSSRPGQGGVELDLRTGARLPAYCTAMGKLLLAAMPRATRSDAIQEIKLTKRGPNTITTKRALREELARIGASHFAVSDQELTAELFMVDAPVHNEAGEPCGAVDLVAHRSMISLQELVDEFGPRLVSATDRISARLGYRRDHEIVGGR